MHIGKLRRIFGQFGPYVWVSYDWKPLSSLGRWVTTLGIIAIILLLCCGFHQAIGLNLIRLILILPWGAVAIREVFQYLDDPILDNGNYT
ncbi:hypothetical protein Anas_06844 [Armadillidium nasatum]|uniref:Phosphatidylserine synthase n=1 Tax=Armadillidium nasatum TaxID=96803 RepID=A0A5N5T9M0_9CRUS|nr:hypothetical protein Anas_06844 [Armadillidium nasatum]